MQHVLSFWRGGPVVGGVHNFQLNLFSKICLFLFKLSLKFAAISICESSDQEDFRMSLGDVFCGYSGISCRAIEGKQTTRGVSSPKKGLLGEIAGEALSSVMKQYCSLFFWLLKLFVAGTRREGCSGGLRFTLRGRDLFAHMLIILHPWLGRIVKRLRGLRDALSSSSSVIFRDRISVESFSF